MLVTKIVVAEDALIPFSKEKLSEILNQIDRALEKVETPIAAFDADGTLWSHDAGEQFFEYEFKNKLVDGLPADPWKHYHDLKANVSKETAYLWLAQINAGKSLEEVRSWSQRCLEDNAPTPIFPEQKAIIDHLHSNNVEVYVVTASIKWAVEPGAALYGIDQDHVIGITTHIENGIVTEKQGGPITYREGKVTGLLEKTNGIAPFFTSGNTEGDLPLLEASTHLRMVMASAPKEIDPEMFEIEQGMIQLAQKNGWFHHSYV